MLSQLLANKEEQNRLRKIELEVADEQTKSVNEFLARINSGECESPAKWAAKYLWELANEEWLTHRSPEFAPEGMYLKKERKYRKLRWGSGVTGKVYAVGKRGNMHQISTSEMGLNQFQTAAWAIKSAQATLEAMTPRENYCTKIKEEDEAITRFIEYRDQVMKEWKRADEELEGEEGEQAENIAMEQFILICKKEARWIREVTRQKVLEGIEEENAAMTEWSEAEEIRWHELNEMRDESEVDSEAEEDAEEDEEDRMNEELEKEIEAIGEGLDKRTDRELDALWDYPVLPPTQSSQARSTTSTASTTRISYNTKLNNIADYPPNFMQEASQEEVSQIKQETEEQAEAIIESFLEDETMEWEAAAEIIAVKAEGEMRRKNYVDGFVRKEIMDTIRGTVKRKWGDQQTHDREAEGTPSARKIHPPREKKRAVEELITGLLSSRWSSQEEMVKRRGERKKQAEEIRKRSEEEEKKEEEKKRRESLKKREESEKASERREEERRMVPTLPTNTPLTSENMRGWFEAVSANMADQERKIKSLQEEVKWLRARGGGGKGKGRAGNWEKKDEEVRNDKEESPEYFPRPPPPRGPGGPARPSSGPTQGRRIPPALPPRSYAAAASASPPSRGTNTNTTPIGNQRGRAPPPTPPTAQKKQEQDHFREAREVKRDMEATKKFEVILSTEENAKQLIASGGLSTLARELGIEEGNLISCRAINGKNAIEVICKDQETRDRAAKKGETKIGEIEASIRKVENWTGIVIGGIEVAWGASEEKWKELGRIIGEENNVLLTKTPRWLIREDKQVKGSTHQSIVVHVAKAQDRQNLVEGGAKFQGNAKFTRLFESARDKARKQCTKCCGYGHLWYECRGKETCGKCGKDGHTAYTHRVTGRRF